MCRSVLQESLEGTGGNRKTGRGETVIGPLVGDERWGMECPLNRGGSDGRHRVGS